MDYAVIDESDFLRFVGFSFWIDYVNACLADDNNFEDDLNRFIHSQRLVAASTMDGDFYHPYGDHLAYTIRQQFKGVSMWG